MITRRQLLCAASVLALSGPSFLRIAPARAEESLPLAFDPKGFTDKTVAVETSAGTRTIRYRFWRAIPYVARPVDVAYQSLNVSVPVEVDGAAVDASDAPILLANSVGGYMPASVIEAEGVGARGMGGGRMAGEGQGTPGVREPGDGGPGRAARHGGAPPRNDPAINAKLALAAGMVVVEPGARGRTLVNEDGVYYGTAPAAIVDLKAAVRWLRHNRDALPGDVERIVSSGTSAGGALSALLGASGDDPRYAPYLCEIGAAETSDAIFAAGCWCPISDLGHADMAYEWNWGANPLPGGGTVDQALSRELREGFAEYQLTLGLRGDDGQRLTADTYGDYLIERYFAAEATRFLAALSERERAAYLAANPAIAWQDGAASFTWEGFLAHVGARKKGLPAFDAFDLSTPENNLFGIGTTKARHFTPFGLRHGTGDADAALAADIAAKRDMMNPMVFLHEENSGRALHWWLRTGTKDSDTSLTVLANLAASLEKRGHTVDTRYYWDAGHAANEDPEAFVAWISGLHQSG